MTVWEQRLKQAEEACRRSLQEAPQGLGSPEDCFSALGKEDPKPASRVPFPRWTLINASLAALPRVRDWPVADSVKRLWADEILFCIRAEPNENQFSELARIVTFRRAPAGQFHWEMSGFPRSYVLHTPKRNWPDLFKLLRRSQTPVLAGALRGFHGFVDLHLNARRKNRLTVSEREGILSYFRLARSLELQPEIKGVCTCSWLYCETTGEVSPTLTWLRRFYLENGAFLASVGPAPPDSGFLEGSEERRKLYAQGAYRPSLTYALWLREDILSWAKRNPDLEASA